MPRIALAAVFACLMSPLAHAASDAPKPPANPPAMAAHPAPATKAGAENCGTPDEFKPCPPLPRHNLPTYPANKR